jgi:nicotinate phosphoribosyltransferase
MNDAALGGLLTDKYELTMLAAALRDGTATRQTTFELFARRLPQGRRYGVVAGTGRLLQALPQFRFDDEACELLAQFLDADTLSYLRDFRFGGDMDGYPEGELYFPGSPILSVRGSFAECVVIETLALSIFNHDCAIASAAARMVSAAGERPLMDMGTRGGRRGQGGVHRRFRRDVQPGGSAAIRDPDRGHRRARLHHAPHPEGQPL